MAIPMFLKVMWLFLASVAASFDARLLQQEFPQLANVIYSICGLTDLDVSASHPCHFSIFGMAYLFTECGHHHSSDGKALHACVTGCTMEDRCAVACSNQEVKREHCLPHCQRLKGCMIKATDGTVGRVSASEKLERCFDKALPTPASAVLTATPRSPAAVAAASPAVAALLAQSGPAPAPALGPQAIGAPSASLSAGRDASFTPRAAIALKNSGLIDPKCGCSKSGIIGAVNTGQGGCAKHGKEPNAHVEAYCYVEAGMSCGGAMPSQRFPGLHWVNCEKPNLKLLYPPTCEILQRAELKMYDVPSPLGAKAPPSEIGGMIKKMKPVAAESSPLDEASRGFAAWAQPLPPSWHIQRQNEFANEAFQTHPVLEISSSPAAAPAAAPIAAVSFFREVPDNSRSQLRGSSGSVVTASRKQDVEPHFPVKA